MTSPAPVLDIDGPAAPPRRNGELVFDEPWQGRAFGLTMSLVGRGAISYDAFRERLIAQIASWERAHPQGGDFSYYRCWLGALEEELASRRVVDAVDLAVRTAVLAARAPGHDHEHEHGHERGHLGDEQAYGHGHG